MIRNTILIILASAIAGSAWAQQCSQTSNFMRTACKFEVRDDFYEEFAVCRNLTGVMNVQACQAEARATLTEEAEFCEEVWEARNEICELSLVGDGPYDPLIDPDNFLSPEEAAASPNPFFPLIPGTVMVYEAAEDEEVITVTVTEETREIMGVECFVVNDVVADQDGEVIEDTDDYFAVDSDNNVWYFGEIAKNFEDGYLTDIEGSFIGGVDGAKPGIIMLATPQAGDGYRQEFFLGDAEDAGEVLSTTGDESVEIADCEGACIVINDVNPNEPDADEDKYYLSGVGLILEVDNEEGGRVELIEIINP